MTYGEIPYGAKMMLIDGVEVPLLEIRSVVVVCPGEGVSRCLCVRICLRRLQERTQRARTFTMTRSSIRSRKRVEKTTRVCRKGTWSWPRRRRRTIAR